MLKPRTACREVVRAVQALYHAQGRRAPDESLSERLRCRRASAFAPWNAWKGALSPHRANRGCAGGKARSTLSAAPSRWSIAPPCSCRIRRKISNATRSLPAKNPAAVCPCSSFWFFSASAAEPSCASPSAIGKNHDLRLLRGLLEALQKGDVLLVETRAYGEYLTLATLPLQGVDVV